MEYAPDEFDKEEFQRFRTTLPNLKWKNVFPSIVALDLMASGKHFMLYSYQLFVQHFLNPNTQYKRLLLNHGTGSGKTITAISVGLKFIQAYKKEDMQNMIGTVFVLGFTEPIFMRDLIKYPELQFITREEQERYRALTKRATRDNSAEAIASLKELNTKIRRRFNNRANNGYFVFIGYRAFFNRMFALPDGSAISPSLSELQILKMIADKKIIVNQPLLARLKNSLIICDEVHKIYNSFEKNNWGVAIQYALDNVPSLRAMFMSATPLNNMPSEICDLLNLLLSKRINKSDLFNKNEQLLPGALEYIAKLSYGYVSFLVDLNRHGFPDRILDGESITGIPYLKFIKIPMTTMQWKILKSAPTTLQRDEMHTLDIAFTEDLANVNDIKNTIETATDAWKSKHKIHTVNGNITGAFLRLENIGEHSNKYKYLLTEILDCIKQGKGKIFIYHHLVHISGILLICEILNQNGICSESAIPQPNSLCICGNPLKMHKIDVNEVEHTKNSTTHSATKDDLSSKGVKPFCAFKPVRYTAAYGELPHNFVQMNIDKFNSADNTNGESIMIIIGSRKIQEGYDLKAVRQVFVVGRPENIPTLKQILGRAIRKNSHYLLPPEKRNVTIKILLGMLPESETTNLADPRQYEVLQYIRKMNRYIVIQKIEKILHENAVDIDRLNTPEYKKTLHDFSANDGNNFDMLPVVPHHKVHKHYDPSGYNAFYSHEKLEETIWLIKRLFIEYSTVWTYDDLWYAVRNPPVTIEWLPLLDADKGIFAAALQMLHNHSNSNLPPIQFVHKLAPEFLMNESLLNLNERVLYYSSQDTRIIVKINTYYMAVPTIVNNMQSPQNMHIKSKIANSDMEFMKGGTSHVIDYNCFIKNTSLQPSMAPISIDAFLSKHKSVTNYEDQKQRFITKWEHISINNMEIAICDFGIDFHERFVEDCIEYVFGLFCGAKKNTGAPANAPQPQKKSKHHSFMFKMITYYGIRGFIIWAHNARDYVYQNYKKYVMPTKAMLRDKTRDFKVKQLTKNISDTTGLVNLLLSSINQNIFKWIPNETKAQYDYILEMSTKRLNKPSAKWQKVPSDILPIGHMVKNLAKFWYLYNKLEWNSDPEYVKNSTIFNENPIIIGYDDKSRTAVNIQFKIRSPIQTIKKHRDARFIERGGVCSSKPKTTLIKLAIKLEIGTKEELSEFNVTRLTDEIRVKLIYNELRERIKRTNIKWFYFYYETQPRI